MVVGDLNARIGDWSLMTDDDVDVFDAPVAGDNTRRSNDKCTNQFGKILIEFCSTFQCTPLNEITDVESSHICICTSVFRTNKLMKRIEGETEKRKRKRNKN